MNPNPTLTLTLTLTLPLTLTLTLTLVRAAQEIEARRVYSTGETAHPLQHRMSTARVSTGLKT